VGDLLLRCVPDPQQGPGTPPCPAGHVVTTLDANLPIIVSIDDFGFYAALSAALILTLFVSGLGLGWVIGLMKGVTRL
jgi:hypothetical protein